MPGECLPKQLPQHRKQNTEHSVCLNSCPSSHEAKLTKAIKTQKSSTSYIPLCVNGKKLKSTFHKIANRSKFSIFFLKISYLILQSTCHKSKINKGYFAVRSFYVNDMLGSGGVNKDIYLQYWATEILFLRVVLCSTSTTCRGQGWQI